jgi:hypothetical protein
MPTFEFKNLPKGFEYPLTKKEIREFVKGLQANFESVEFSGLSTTESLASAGMTWLTNLHLGILKARRAENIWTFSLKVNGLRSERFGNHRDEIAQTLLADVDNWVNVKLRLPPTAPEKPTELHLAYDVKRNVSNSFEAE